MKLLFCSEFYSPSVGGVQEVVRQLAERLAERGHDCTVATSRIPGRTLDPRPGLRIREFDVAGNMVRGIQGAAEEYRRFVGSCGADAILVVAAQQWTFDALLPVLGGIGARKYFIPCGFSGLYDPAYRDYFARIPPTLRLFDRLVFHSPTYRDIEFARAQGLENLVVIPNGASEKNFRCPQIRPSGNASWAVRMPS